MAGQAVFKGGTALSKCYQLIERFSEDIDIVVLYPGENDNRLKKRIRDISKLVEGIMPEVEIAGITNKLGQIRKTAHTYSKGNFNGSFGQVRENIILKVTWLGNFEPFVTREVSSYLTRMMEITGQSALITEYGLQPFPVRVLSKERTLCEKIMSLERFSRTESLYEDITQKIRHVYDIYMLLRNREVQDFFLYSDDFEAMLNQVGKDDIKSFKNNNAWLVGHPGEALIFFNFPETWKRIKTPYRTIFRDLVIGPLPDESDLIEIMEIVANRIKAIKWSITPDRRQFWPLLIITFLLFKGTPICLRKMPFLL
jgi:predicted nucleotidyltransferase component of viral defense system